jgi:dTDP-4-dehydrorhamnose reductase
MVAPAQGVSVMRWLVFGAAGQLGVDLVRSVRAASLSEDVVALTHAECDVRDRDIVSTVLREHQPDVVINAAAWTAVDEAEDPSKEAEALRVNGVGPSHMVAALKEFAPRTPLLHISTDYVFAGDREADAALPYDEDDAPAPRTAYGRTKLAGEHAVLAYDRGVVVRTAWLYGVHGTNFVRTMLHLERSRETVDVVNDQWGQPTWTADLAAQIIDLGRVAVAEGSGGTPVRGVFHGTNSGATTWCGFARAIFSGLGADPERVHAVTTSQFPRPAPRPAWSVLGHRRWAEVGLAPMRPWQVALTAALPHF